MGCFSSFVEMKLIRLRELIPSTFPFNTFNIFRRNESSPFKGITTYSFYFFDISFGYVEMNLPRLRELLHKILMRAIVIPPWAAPHKCELKKRMHKTRLSYAFHKGNL